MTTSTAQSPVAALPTRAALRRSTRRRTPRWWEPACGAVVGLLLAVVVWLWLVSGGIADVLESVPSALTAAGRLAGLLASLLMLVQVVMMARVPVVERAFGQDRLAAAHRLVGFTSFHLMVVHVVAVLLGYGAGAEAGVLARAWEVLLTFPGMLLAAAGTVFLVLVVVTSVRVARRRLRYESWHLLHLYAYLGAGLALPHQLWTGTSFTASPLATAFWWGLWWAALGCVVCFRLGLPLARTLRHQLRVTSVVAEGPGVVSVHLGGRRLDALPVAAGQFFLLRFLGRPGWTRAHPYSLSAAPSGRGLRFTVKDLGDGSGDAARVPVGTRVAIEGPYGRLTADSRTRDRLLLMAAGVGVTPMAALLDEAQPDDDAVLLYRTRGGHDAVLLGELEEVAQARGARFLHLPGARAPARASTWLPAAARHLTEAGALLHLVPDAAARDVYVCGPPAWADAAVAAARGAGVPHGQLHVERFGW